jgi:mRNA interferase MazF
VVKKYIPDRGDLIKLSFSPQQGREQAGNRPALVISPLTYNRISHFVLACPITSKSKGWRFEVPLPKELTIHGVVLVDQIRVLDWQARKAIFLEKVPHETVVEEVLAKLSPLVS